MTREIQARFSRRDWLRMSLIAGMTIVSAFGRSWWPTVAFAETRDPFHRGRKIGDIDFVGEFPFEMNAVVGTELDGRLCTDLSTLTHENPITPTKDFYIRTRVSRLLEDNPRAWTMRFAGL